MKRNLTRILLGLTMLFSLVGCDPFSFPPPSGLSSMGIHLVSIPSCILNETDLEIKTQVFVDVMNPDGTSSPFDEKAFYSSEATNNPANIWHMGVVDIPATGVFFITIKSKVVTRGSTHCDKPFYPRDYDINNPGNTGMYDDWGCCFATICCACSELPDSPETQHRFDRRFHMDSAPTSIASVGQHLTNSLNCFCCDF